MFSKNAYVSQTIAYLKNNMNAEAYQFSKEFVSAFPEEIVSNYLFSHAAYAVGKFEESASAARKAFNLSKTKEDMRVCAIRSCLAYYQLKEYQKGLSMLEEISGAIDDTEIEQLAFIFSAALKKPEKYGYYLNKMIERDEKAAKRFLESIAKP